jgi:hypothetical protein
MPFIPVLKNGAFWHSFVPGASHFMNFLEKIYKKSDAVVSRKIGDEFILVPIRQDVGDLESIYTLNETAALIWELIDGETQVSKIKEKIVEEFEVEPEDAEKDLIAHLQQLEGIKAIMKD